MDSNELREFLRDALKRAREMVDEVNEQKSENGVSLVQEGGSNEI